MVADIVTEISLGSVTGNTDTGSILDLSRITRKSAWVQVLTGSLVTVSINGGYDANNTNFVLDSKTYESGTALQQDVFSYNSDIPFLSADTSGVISGTTSVVFTGRGV